jgi:hypothetical protein
VITLPTLTTELILTADDPLGDSWPDGSCSVVRRLNDGWTLWRRLSLREQIPILTSPTARGDGSTHDAPEGEVK